MVFDYLGNNKLNSVGYYWTAYLWPIMCWRTLRQNEVGWWVVDGEARGELPSNQLVVVAGICWRGEVDEMVRMDTLLEAWLEEEGRWFRWIDEGVFCGVDYPVHRRMDNVAHRCPSWKCKGGRMRKGKGTYWGFDWFIDAWLCSWTWSTRWDMWLNVHCI